MLTYQQSFIGGMQVALLLSSAMWGITSLQMATYYRKFQQDFQLLKILVGVIWVFDTVYIVCIACAFYEMTVLDVNSDKIPLVMSAGAGVASVVQSLVQAVYAFRLYRLLKNIYIPALCWIAASYNFAAGIAFDCITANQPKARFVQLEREFQWLLSSLYSATAAVDVVITVTLCYILLKKRSGAPRRTINILDHLILYTIQTGLITSIVAILIVVLFDTIQQPGIWISLTIVITTLYPTTLITMLNGRSVLLRNLPHQDSSGGLSTVCITTVPESHLSASVLERDTAQTKSSANLDEC
ncbi:hypothetical protein AMATHDRAFT_63903 [Amanita thiersii Skay4041]|uniref:DUF6534 domain-containing protein n=1 Tax=Amanita thiersii Skay4041 TaxID=703135 RepID=A0A2A9NDI2_9AGAR|nr:hypothetical protein AMATHDRAFT_63903 [Amanita thiersii Skay4041]